MQGLQHLLGASTGSDTCSETENPAGRACLQAAGGPLGSQRLRNSDVIYDFALNHQTVSNPGGGHISFISMLR